MSRLGKLFPSLLAGAAILVVFALAGCHSNSNPSAAEAQPDQDPATVNLANASNTTPAAENPPPPPADQGASAQPASAPSNAAPAPPEYSDQAADGDQDPGDEGSYDDTAYDVAPEPPPVVPDYEQPECPGDDYEWTPGYWAYAPAGYYWVPGAWVLAPYVGALWTPGYWGWDTGRYHWHHGYWGAHVGFYGGVNYGYGYGGDGYEGGYWRGRDFYYNRTVTRVNVTVVRNVYNYRVTNVYNNTRVSYNGGNGGLHYRPTQAQVASQRERHFAPLPAQRSNAHDAMQNRGQFASENHGRPQMVAASRPINEGRSAPAPRAEDFHPAPSSAGRNMGGRPGANAPAPNRAPKSGLATRPGAERPGAERPGANGRPEPNRGNGPAPQPGNRAPLNVPRPQPGAGARPQPGRPVPESRPTPQPGSRPGSQPGTHPGSQPGSRPSPYRQPESRPGAQPRPESRPVPQAPRPESRPQQQPRPQPEVRQAEPRPESRPAPQESRPAAPAHQESRPAPKEQPHPQGKPEDKHPQ